MAVQTVIPYVLALIFNSNNEILLQHRTHTAWFSGYYGLVGGKVEEHESARQALARELSEEIGITVDPESLECAHVMHFMGETRPCVAFFFVVHSWQGTISNQEKDKHDRLTWFRLDNLPNPLIPRHAKALEQIGKKVLYSEDNWPKNS